jgi:hypothetical protein
MAFPVDTTVSRLGQINQAGDSRELFLELFSGEVLTTFQAENIALKLTRVRRIKNGKSASFALMGENSAEYHKAGELIEGNKINHAKRIVTIDDVAISPVFIDDLDEAMNHYDVRAHYSGTCARALAGLIDRNIFRQIAKAASITDATMAQAAGLTVLPEETYTANITLAAAGDEFDGAKLVDAIFKARTQLRKANIKERAVVVLPPEQYEALVNVQDVTKVAWINADTGGVGNVADGVIPRVAGMPVFETNNLPQTDETLGTSDPEPIADSTLGSGNAAKYRGDYSKVVGLVFTMSAVATTQLWDITTVHVPEPLRLGHTIYAKMAVGHDILRPCCAIAIYKA